MESVSSNRRLIELGGAWSVGVLACRCLGEWGGHFDIIVATEGPRRASKVSIMPDFPYMPSVWGSNQARIAFDRRNLLLRLIFVNTWVKSVSSSNYTWWAGKNSSSDHVVWLPEGNFTFPRKDALLVRLEVVLWLCGCWLWERPANDIWACNSSFSYLSRLVRWSRDCICRSLSRWCLFILSCQSK